MGVTVKNINVEQLVATPSAESFSDRMTSLEIAEITGREHKNVLRDIRNILSQGVQQLNFEPMQKRVPTNNGGYKEIPCYNLTKKGCLILASGYDALLREKIIDRWEYLETKNKTNMPNCSNPAEVFQDRDCGETLPSIHKTGSAESHCLNDGRLVYKGGNGQALTTSVLVAEKFGKEHSDVLKAIRNILCPKGENSLFVENQQLTGMFALTYTHGSCAYHDIYNRCYAVITPTVY